MFKKSSSVDKKALTCVCPATGVSEVASAEAGMTFPFPYFSVIFNMCFCHCYLVFSAILAHNYIFETKDVK